MDDNKLSGRVIIATVLANMRQQVEELRYSRVVPAAYDVYLHDDDQQRLESLAHEVAAEAVRALQERLDALNRPSRLDRMRELVGRPRLPYKKVGPWLVRIARDPEGAVPRGRALVVSQITLAAGDAFEGQRTRRLATFSEPAASADLPRLADAPAPAAIELPGVPAASAPRPVTSPAPATAASPLATATEVDRTGRAAECLAVLSWTDEAGAHRFRVTAPEVTVGRDAPGGGADVRLATSADVSRTHFRLRLDPASGRFSIEDLSLLGTTVNGERLPPGARRELPAAADLRLADVITLRFEPGPPS